MKTIWICVPTEGEKMGLSGLNLEGNVQFLVTGIGMVNTAISLERALHNGRPDFLILAGIAGSWKPQYPIGSVVQTGWEIMGELGASSPAGFLSLEQLCFVNFEVNGKSYFNIMENPTDPLPDLPIVRSLCVHRVHGELGEIEQARSCWDPDIENMEGAAFFQVCLQHGIPFAEIRAISNRVEPRNRDNWDIPGALKSLSSALSHAVAQVQHQGSR